MNQAAAPTPHAPDQVDLGGLLWTVLLNTALAVTLCWDAVASGGRKVVGAPDGELFPFLWGQWWVGESMLKEGKLPLATTLLDYPMGGTLWVKDPITALITLPVQLLAGLPTAFTCSMILIFVGSGVGFFLLARLLGASRLTAVVTSLTFAFCPHVLGEAYNSNLEAMAGGWCALWLWSLLRATRRGGLGPVLLAAVMLFCLLVTNQYFGLAMALVTGPVLAAGIYEARGRRPWKRQLASAMGAGLLGLGFFLPMALMIKGSMQGGQALSFFEERVIFAVPFVSDLKHLIFPLVPLTGPSTLYTPFQDIVYPGLITAGLALLAPLLGRPGPWRWLWSASGLLFLVLSLGPALLMDGNVIKAGGEAITLPWSWLITDRPLVGSMTLPHRMAVPTALFLSLGLAWSLDGLRRRFARAPRVAFGLALIYGLGCLAEILFYPPYRVPLYTTDVTPKPHARLLAAMPGQGAVLNLPLSLGQNTLNTYLYWQTVHGRPIAASLRVGAAPSLVRQVSWFSNLAKDQQTPLEPHSADASVPRRLVAQGYHFVVIHGFYWTVNFGDTNLRLWLDTLERTLGRPIVLADHTMVYPLRQEDRELLSQKATQVLGPRALQAYPPNKNF